MKIVVFLANGMFPAEDHPNGETDVLIRDMGDCPWKRESVAGDRVWIMDGAELVTVDEVHFNLNTLDVEVQCGLTNEYFWTEENKRRLLELGFKPYIPVPAESTTTPSC